MKRELKELRRPGASQRPRLIARPIPMKRELKEERKRSTCPAFRSDRKAHSDEKGTEGALPPGSIKLD